jgi:hypothetical protein
MLGYDSLGDFFLVCCDGGEGKGRERGKVGNTHSTSMKKNKILDFLVPDV